ncbi:MAG: hybrid sensor histidine kinase/response regulator [Verrucomicrobia bacterium]|nr:hybrid sensor histidine kinase/response regulator [Verrucomicrobiota bacterium]
MMPGMSQPPNPTQAPFQFQGRRILVVDDDRLNLRILAGILRPEGYVTSEASSGERALELIPEFKPNLVLLDVMMPGIDGFEACRRIKATYGEKSPPVIFITAKSESDDVVEGLGAGGVDYLPKPFKPKEVLARIRSHLYNQILSEQQKSLVEQLSKANAAKNRFLGMAAHDLRNPLASIRGLSEFLRDGAVGPLTADQLDLVQTIHAASQSMLEMLNQLLDVAAIEAGELKLHLEPTNLGDLAARSVAMINIEAGKKRTRVEFARPDPPVVLPADSAKMKQVIDNLLSNAVKYSPPGSTIRAYVQSGPAAAQCCFFVRDQGPGIPDDERDKLFKDFGRLSSKPTAGEKSTGLGLAICRNIVEAHRGTIAVANLPEGGCEFRVMLPSPA